jgi:hypothetical protein
MPKYTPETVGKVLEKAKPAQMATDAPSQPESAHGVPTVASPPASAPSKTEPVAESKGSKKQSLAKPPGKRKSAAEKQDQLIGVHCTKAEAQLINEMAQHLGVKPGRCLVDCTLKKTSEILANHELYSEVRLQKLIEKVLAAPKKTNQTA